MMKKLKMYPVIKKNNAPGHDNIPASVIKM